MLKFPSFFTFLLLIITVIYSIYSSKSQQISDLSTDTHKFSTQRALQHVKEISETSHYVGSTAHESVREYIVTELQKLGLDVQIQEGTSISKTGSVCYVHNILTSIKGTENTKSLVLMTHYDSAPHSSFGASDAGSGVATILEGARAYIATNKTPKNDIIISIMDGEELGLNGAQLFIQEHPWAKDVGLALNFEARGSGGDSYMLLESNDKNGKMISEFSKAGVTHPVSNSLAYSVYKMMPNNTDLTVFREQGNISGFNFAFIDDHFDYHTSNDIWQNLDLNTLQHQGNYLMPLLAHFSEIDISNLSSEKDYIYFNIPIFKFITYPFDWIVPLFIIATILFIALIFYGRFTHRINFKEVLVGFAAFLLCLLLSGGLTFGGWKLILWLYPHYNEIQHGFTYNGYLYITAFVLLSLGLYFRIYAYFSKAKNQFSLCIAPLLIWLILCLLAALYLKGASYFIIVVFFSLVSLFVLVRQKTPNPYLLVLLGIPAICILFPFILSFPVALGLNILFVSSVLSVLLFGALLPIFGFYRRKKLLGTFSLLLSVVFLFIAHLKSDFTSERQKPNSLLYILDTDQNKAVWATYDHTLDPWSKNYIQPDKNIAENYNATTFQSKYNSSFAYVNTAPLKRIEPPRLHISKDTVINQIRYFDLCIAPHRSVQRMEIYTKTLFNFDSLKVNGKTAMDFEYTNGNTYNAFTKRWSNNLVTYHVTNNRPLELQMQFHKDSLPELTIYESSYDLLDNALFSIPSRNKDMIPKPFVINDAIVVKKRFIIQQYQEKKADTLVTTSSNEIHTTL